LATIVLFFILIYSCDKPAKLNINPKTNFMVNGEINNLEASLQIYDVKKAAFLTSQDLSMQIHHNGITNDLIYKDNRFSATNHIPPGSNYQLSLFHSGKTTTFSNVLPDTIDQATLSITQTGDYSYQQAITLSIDDPSPDNFIFWSSSNENFYAFTQPFFLYGFIDETNTTVINSDNDSTGVLGTSCLNPPRYKNTYQYQFKRVSSSMKDFFQYIIDYWNNHNNALFVAYPFSGDEIKNDYVFRIASTTQILTNPVIITDTSRICFEVYTYDKDGFPLSQTERSNGFISIYINSIYGNYTIPLSDKNPTTISVGDLATVTNKKCELNMKLEDALNTPIIIAAVAYVTNEEIYQSSADVTLSSLNETKKISLRLK